MNKVKTTLLSIAAIATVVNLSADSNSSTPCQNSVNETVTKNKQSQSINMFVTHGIVVNHSLG
jgi:hypothetical protein